MIEYSDQAGSESYPSREELAAIDYSQRAIDNPELAIIAQTASDRMTPGLTDAFGEHFGDYEGRLQQGLFRLYFEFTDLTDGPRTVSAQAVIPTINDLFAHVHGDLELFVRTLSLLPSAMMTHERRYGITSTSLDRRFSTLYAAVKSRASSSNSLGRRVMESIPEIAPEQPILSPAELEHFEFASLGLTASETARQVYFSKTTIRLHRSAVIHKLEARNMIHSVRIGYSRGLLKRSVSNPEFTEQLTKKQLEVLKLASLGFSSGETAALLGIEKPSEKNRRGSILLKLGAKNMAHAVRIAIENDILDISGDTRAVRPFNILGVVITEQSVLNPTK